MACCGSGIATVLNAITLIFLGITFLMAVDAWLNAAPNAQDGVLGGVVMTVLFGLAGIMGELAIIEGSILSFLLLL